MNQCFAYTCSKGKGKVIPLQDVGRPLGLQEVEDPRITNQSAREGSNVVSCTNRLSLPPSPRRYPNYSFLLETESTPGPSAAGRFNSMKNPNDPIRNRNHSFTYSVIVRGQSSLILYTV